MASKAASPSKLTAQAAPGILYVCGGKVEVEGKRFYKVKVGVASEEGALRQAATTAYQRSLYVNPEGLRPIIPPQHLVDTTFFLKVHVPNCRLAQYLAFFRLRELGAADQGDDVFADVPEGEDGAGLLAKPAARKLLEQVSTAAWVFQDQPGQPVQQMTTLPPGWPARQRASLG